MDAERLVEGSRHALANCGDVMDVIAEAWQAQALAHAIGNRLALTGPPELRNEARELAEAGGRGCGLPDHPGPAVDGIRALRLSGVADAQEVLARLGELLDELGIALVAVACATDEEGLYWQCIEAVDTADETGDRASGLLRRLVSQGTERGGRQGL